MSNKNGYCSQSSKTFVNEMSRILLMYKDISTFDIINVVSLFIFLSYAINYYINLMIMYLYDDLI